ncbi:MAG: hypothetical protein ACFFEE_01195 [Candidatus Thorarchaeota archaeon]
MIASERNQNIIVTFVIIIALVSSVFLVNNIQAYSGSYALAGSLEVNPVRTVVRDVDPSNASLFPIISFTFNFYTDAQLEGNVRLNFMDAAVYLNDDHLSLMSFERTLTSDADQILYPGYDRNFTLAQASNADSDRNTILDANNTSTWNWYIRFRYNFIIFDESRSLTWRVLYFNWTGSTTVI